jgi:hypothetical protein
MDFIASRYITIAQRRMKYSRRKAIWPMITT